MPKGGPLAFLNKKPWHPARFQNQEEVWKREQKQAAEERKLEELKKQYEEERRNEEILDVARSAGHLKDTGRLDWMYAGSLAAKEDAAKKQEEALLGQRTATLAPTETAADSRCDVAASLASTRAPAIPQSANEQWNRLTNDPLLMIKKQQQEALRNVRENPIKMQEILQAVRQEKEKKKDKKHKKDKKKHKKDKRHRHSSGSDSSDDEKGGAPRAPAAPQPLYKPVQAAAAPAPAAPQCRPVQAATLASEARQEGGRKRSRSPSRSRSRSPGRGGRDHTGRQGPHPDRHGSRGTGGDARDGGRGEGYDRERDGRDNRDGRDSRGGPDGADRRGVDKRGDQGYERGRDSKDRDRGRGHAIDDRGRDAGREREDRDRADGRNGGRGDRERDDGHDDHRPQQGGRREEEREEVHRREGGRQDRERGSDRGRSRGHGDTEPASGPAHQRPPHSRGGDDEGREAAAQRYGYGLSQNVLAPEAVQRYDTSTRAADTRTRLAEAAKRKEEEERAAAAQRYQRKEYKTGRMTEEERQARLAQMTSNAEVHDAARASRVQAANDADVEADTKGRVANTGGVTGGVREGDAFLGAASRDVYGALAGADLAARVNSRRHFAQR